MAKSYICEYCFEGVVKFPFKTRCYGCGNFKRACINCEHLWLMTSVGDASDYFSSVYETCSIKCNITIINDFTMLTSTKFSVSDLLKEQQEEILQESRKNAIKSMIQPLNYFINDILCEIMEYHGILN